MEENKNFKFRISISKESYESKEVALACVSSLKKAKEYGRKGKMAFKETEVTIDEFLNYATNGYSFCNLFEFDENYKYWVKSSKWWNKEYPVYQRGVNKGFFKLKFKSDDYARGSQVVFDDIDYTEYTSMDEYIARLTYPPTCGYYSYSDKKDKRGILSRRFRLVYVFDEVINPYEFQDLVKKIYDTIAEDTKEPTSDNCGCSLSQYMNGGQNPDTYKSYYIYSKADFIKEQPVEDTPMEIINKLLSASNNVSVSFTNELVSDMGKYSFDKVVKKWWAQGLRYFTETPVSFGNNYYVTTTEDYVQLGFFGKKVTDGHHRRSKLSCRAKLRRLIKEDVTPDELLFNLYIDREKFFDNSDGMLTIKLLQEKVIQAFQTDMAEIRKLAARYRKPKFVINPTVGNKWKAEAAARTDITNSYIEGLYDTDATIEVNLIRIYQGGGRKIRKSRLYEWCKENNITPAKKPVVNGYNPSLSERKNAAMLGCTRHQIRRAKMAQMKTLKAG